MKYQRLFFLCCIFIAAFLPQSSHACTTFCLESADGPVIGKNFDWPIGDALVVVNKRNVAKTAYFWTGEQTASWTSKYGSVTFNPHGRERPFSGMNEAGLVVSAMGLSATIFQTPDSRPVVSALTWIQYQLDNAATVEQVLESNFDLRISNSDPTTLHFLVCDSMGTSATIEFINGEFVYHTQETMPVKVLTNSQYSSDLEYWKKGEIPAQDWSTTERFFTAAQMLEDYDPASSGPALDYTFDILSSLGWWIDTQWSIAYDIQNQRVNFHTLDNEDIRYFDMNSFDFSCLTPVKILDVQEDLSGDISGDFINYTYEINRNLIEKTYANYDTSDEYLDALANYPETTVCADACELNIRYKKIKSKKLSKSRKRVLHITGDEGFDIFGQIDLGPITLRKKSFSAKKNRLKIKVLVPAGLRPGTVPIWVGSCFGEIEVLP
jgi:penicillin V acylase-like amidase (Ntn superfamily)